MTLTGLTCFFIFYFEVDNLPSTKFFFHPSSQKFVFAISSPFQRNFIYIFSFKLLANLFGTKGWYFYYGKCSLVVWL